jgi:hypothetical protein
MVLAVIGGLIGMLAGLRAARWLISQPVRHDLDARLVTCADSVLLATGFSAGRGPLLRHLPRHPRRRGCTPIEALRYE